MLHRRGKVFISRIVVPRDLRGLLGRAEITRSLRTTDLREARRKNLLWEPHIGTLHSRLRRYGRWMKQEELEALTQRYLMASFDEIEGRLALDWSPGGLEEYSFQLNERCHNLAGSLAEADLSSVIELAQEMAPGADPLKTRILARRLLEVQLIASKAELRAVCGEPLKRPRASVERVKAVPEVVPKVTPRVSEIAVLYSEERSAQGRWAAKTAAQGRTIFHLIASLLEDPQIGDVTKADIRKLGLNIAKLPVNMTKRYRGLTPAQVLEKVGDDPAVARLEPRSVNKNYQHVRTLFAWATEHDYITQNPASVLHDVEEGRAQDARKVFEDADITALFVEVGKKARESYGIWIPRIMEPTQNREQREHLPIDRCLGVPRSSVRCAFTAQILDDGVHGGLIDSRHGEAWPEDALNVLKLPRVSGSAR